LFLIIQESDKNCAKDVPTFKKCAENIFPGLADKVKASSLEILPRTNKVAAVQNKKKGKSSKAQKESKPAPKDAQKSKASVKSAKKSKKN